MAACVCGHVRCYGLTACGWARPPALEALPPGVERSNVREAFRALALEAMRRDPEWTLHLGRLTALDATR